MVVRIFIPAREVMRMARNVCVWNRGLRGGFWPLAAAFIAAWFGVLFETRGAAEEPAAAVAAKVSYYREIRPIFQARCHGCHQPAKQSGEYMMTTHEGLLAAGESGEAAIAPGDPEASYLMGQIRVTDGKALMPKEGPPLSAPEIDLIEKWIREGAVDDTPASARPRYDMEHPPTYQAPSVITSLDYSPDGKLIAVSGYHEVILHHSDGSGIAARLVGLSERIEAAVFSPDGKRLAVAGGSPGRLGELQIWQVAPPTLERSLTVGYDTIYGARWSPDGKLVAFGCPDNTVRAIDANTGNQALFNGAHNDWVLDTVFSVNSDHLVTVSRDMSMKLINVPTQRFIDNITSITPGALKGGLNSVDRAPGKDEVVIGGADGTPKIYKMYRVQDRKIGDDYNLIRAFPSMPGRVYSVAYSRDGNRIVAGSSLNNTGEVRVYNVADGQQVSQTKVADGGIYAIAIHPDGTTVAAGGFDGKVRIIQVADGAVIREFYPVELTSSR